ncbi:MAG TPA: hypothetical protein VJX69_06380 [Terriglobales bacterium]|nr:hypothetical protein [Terriglobales bacterium]
MAFMLSMIFAFALIAMATVVMTILALWVVRWLLGAGQFLGQVRAPGDTFVDEGTPAFPRHLVIE